MAVGGKVDAHFDRNHVVKRGHRLPDDTPGIVVRRAHPHRERHAPEPNRRWRLFGRLGIWFAEDLNFDFGLHVESLRRFRSVDQGDRSTAPTCTLSVLNQIKNCVSVRIRDEFCCMT